MLGKNFFYILATQTLGNNLTLGRNEEIRWDKFNAIGLGNFRLLALVADVIGINGLNGGSVKEYTLRINAGTFDTSKTDKERVPDRCAGVVNSGPWPWSTPVCGSGPTTWRGGRRRFLTVLPSSSWTALCSLPLRISSGICTERQRSNA